MDKNRENSEILFERAEVGMLLDDALVLIDDGFVAEARRKIAEYRKQMLVRHGLEVGMDGEVAQAYARIMVRSEGEPI